MQEQQDKKEKRKILVLLTNIKEKKYEYIESEADINEFKNLLVSSL